MYTETHRGLAQQHTRPKALRGRTAFAWLAALLLTTVAFSADAQTFRVNDTKTSLVDGVYRLDAKLDFGLSNKALEALLNGVPLTLVLDIEVRHPRRYLWDEVIATLEQRFRLQYHALSEQYQLHNLNSGFQSSYSSLSSALRALGNISALPIIDAQLLDPGEHYMVSMRTRLDFDSLPVPLRIQAYFSRDWWLASGWYSLDLEAQ